jgi:hypothetical protein
VRIVKVVADFGIKEQIKVRKSVFLEMSLYPKSQEYFQKLGIRLLTSSTLTEY